MDEPTTVSAHVPAARRTGFGFGRIAFLTFLAGAGIGLLVWTSLRAWRPASAPDDVAAQARDYLRKRKVAPLSGSLQKLLASPNLTRTQDHRLLAQPAPDFALSDPDGKVGKLSDLLKEGPVVVVFYYGYHCDHCVGQLFAVNEDLAHFRELGAQVVAISADLPERTRERFKQYGAFGFPVLSDPGNRVAQAYNVYRPAEAAKKESLLHGTFVIDRNGVVQWVNVGDEPFTGNQTLLYHLAKLEGRLPAASP